jgi:PAS domain S-box-containing protein
VNRQFCLLHGLEREAILGTDYRILSAGPFDGKEDERLTRMLQGESLLYEAEHYRSDGSKVQLEISARAIEIGGVIHIQSFHRDITEKKQLQEQAIQSQKMESMGVLAGGIAHDFNNTLTAILGHTEVLRRHIRADEFGLRRVNTIENAAKRAGLMVSKLLSFARKESLELVPTDLNMVVMDTAELLGRAFIDRNITPKVETDPAIPAVSGDSIHLEQLITNLVMNAMDAMPGGGTLSITTSAMEVGAQSSKIRPFLAPGKYVVLVVGDTGTGIPPEIRSRMFEPFFTTKPVGKGTGLGLAMVYGIVKSHQGEVWVRSELGVGTTSRSTSVSTSPPAPQPTLRRRSAHGAAGSECILVVTMSRMSSRSSKTRSIHGYKTFATDNSVYAQELFQEMSDDIDLVITDMVMPLMNGAELSRQLKTTKPDIKVIGITGFSGGAIAQAAQNIDRVIKKPFDGARLLTTVRQVLDAAG